MKSRITATFYWGVIFLALCGLAWQFYPVLRDYFVYDFRAITYPYSIDYGEGPLLDQTLRMAKFQRIYTNTFANPPYTLQNYPPLFPLVQVPFIWIFGPSFWYGRLINLICVLLTALCICLTLHTLTNDWIGSVVAGLLLIATPYVQYWSKFNRIDELALTLSWAALFVIVRYVAPTSTLLPYPHTLPDHKLVVLIKKGCSNLPFWIAVILFVGAIFTRQTYAFTAPFAVCVWLVLGARGRRKQRFIQALELCIAVVGITTVLFLILNIATNGGFYSSVVIANIGAFYWSKVWDSVKEIADKLWPLLTVVCLYLIMVIVLVIAKLHTRANNWRTHSQSTQFQEGYVPDQVFSACALVLPYFLAATAVSVAIGKDGSNANYLLEFSAALSLAGGAAIGFAWQWQQRHFRLFIQLLVISVIAYQVNVMTYWNHAYSVAYMEERLAHLTDVSKIAQIVKDTPGIVLADEYMGLIPLAGKMLYLEPFLFKQMSDAGTWDQTPFLKEIADHKFDVILWYEPPYWKAVETRWTVDQRNLINENYTVYQHIGDVYVMRPTK